MLEVLLCITLTDIVLNSYHRRTHAMQYGYHAVKLYVWCKRQ
jgi:hypothetical protein